jgi:hypothetical protein
VLSASPDFWETVRRVVIIGNMIALLQVPSGRFTSSNNQTRFCAWYNCDLFFFEGNKIKYLLFQQDVMYHLSQIRA